jgi:hypothetical protein
MDVIGTGVDGCGVLIAVEGALVAAGRFALARPAARSYRA